MRDELGKEATHSVGQLDVDKSLSASLDVLLDIFHPKRDA